MKILQRVLFTDSGKGGALNEALHDTELKTLDPVCQCSFQRSPSNFSPSWPIMCQATLHTTLNPTSRHFPSSTPLLSAVACNEKKGVKNSSVEEDNAAASQSRAGTQGKRVICIH